MKPTELSVPEEEEDRQIETKELEIQAAKHQATILAQTEKIA